MALQRILLPTDFSPASDEALSRAVGLAIDHGAILWVFHVERAGHDAAQLQARRAEIEARVAELIGSTVPRIGYELRFCRAEAADVVEGIMAQIERRKPDLVVMSTHAGGIVTRSVAEAVVRDASCSVLTCRSGSHGRWPWEPGRVVVSIDFSDDSRRALQVARSVAGPDCPLALVHVTDVPPTPGEAGAFEPGQKDRIEQHLRQWAGGDIESAVAVRGGVRTALREQCRRLDAVLCVVGPHGVHTDPDEDDASTAEGLTRTAPIPVLTAR